MANPNVILEEIQAQASIAEAILPELRGFYRALKHDAQVRFYEGPKAIDRVIKEVLMEAKELSVVGSLTEVVECYPNHFPVFMRQRIKKKIPLRLITSDSEIAAENILLDKKQLRVTKVIKKKDLTSMVWLWSNKVGFISTRGKQFSMVIDDPGIFSIQNTMFDLVWESMN